MKQNKTMWGDGSEVAIEIIEIGGAWYVNFIDPKGIRRQIKKANGGLKGFRSFEALVIELRSISSVHMFNVFTGVNKRKQKRTTLELSEDLYLAECELEAIRAGKSTTTPLSEVMKRYGI